LSLEANTDFTYWNSFSISSGLASSIFLVNHMGPRVFVNIAPKGAVTIMEKTAVVRIASPYPIYSVMFSFNAVSSMIPPIAA
jgi:hypothetical protein